MLLGYPFGMLAITFGGLNYINDHDWQGAGRGLVIFVGPAIALLVLVALFELVVKPLDRAHFRRNPHRY